MTAARLLRHVDAALAGERAAREAIERIEGGTSDSELLTRALCRVLADAGLPAVPPPVEAVAFMRAVQKALERGAAR